MSKRISELPELTDLSGALLDDIPDTNIPIEQGGKNFRFTLKNLSKLVTQVATKETLGLDKVDNTSDLDKPVSTATQTELDKKANVTHEHGISEVNGLAEALDVKAAKQHQHTIDDVSGLNLQFVELRSELSQKSNTKHQHAIGDVEGLQSELDSCVRFTVAEW